MLERNFYDPVSKPVAKHEAPAADPAGLASLHLMAGWAMHFYRHREHDLRTILDPNYWRTAIDRNFTVGDTITAYLGEVGERTIVDLAVLSVCHRPKQVEVSIVGRRKETAVDASHFTDDGPKARSRKA